MRRFWEWVIHVDRILRGETTRLDDFDDDKITFPLGGVAVVLGVLGLISGGCTGSFAFFSDVIYGSDVNPGYSGMKQFFASGIKVPLLFIFTLLVTFPSLYVFNALVGAQLKIASLVRLLTAALVVNMSILAAFGPIVTFFAVCTESYHFMVLLNVVVFATAGIVGMTFLVQSLNRIVIARRHAILKPPVPMKPVTVQSQAKSLAEKIDSEEIPEAQPVSEEALSEDTESEDEELEHVVCESILPEYVPPVTARLAEPPELKSSENRLPDLGPLDPIDDFKIMTNVRRVFSCWIVIFGLVGAQMAWVLRPFIGNPGSPFQWFRERGSNFFASVLESLAALLGL